MPIFARSESRGRLARSKTSDSTTSITRTSQESILNGRDGRELPVRTSCEDLRSQSDARAQLKRQFFSTFPEAIQSSDATGSPPGRLSNDKVPSPSSLNAKDYISKSTSSLALSQSASARSSTLSLSTTQPTPKRLSVVPESKTIDVEAAITILQELKKNASPEELVALHRALLPTKDIASVLNPALSGSDDYLINGSRRLSATRRCSNVPPGLATRGGLDADLLRRQDDPSAWLKQSDEKTQHKRLESKSSIAALDLALDNSTGTSATDATPAEFRYSQIGTYAPGTLRITNGDLSSEPDEKVGSDGAAHPSLVVQNTPIEKSIENPIETPIKNLIKIPIKNPTETPIANPIETTITNSIETPIANPTETPIAISQHPAYANVDFPHRRHLPHIFGVRSPAVTDTKRRLGFQSKSHSHSSASSPPTQRDSVQQSTLLSLKLPGPELSLQTDLAAEEYAKLCGHPFDVEDTVSGDDNPTQSGTPGDALLKLIGSSNQDDVRTSESTTQSQHSSSIGRPKVVSHADSGYASETSANRALKGRETGNLSSPASGNAKFQVNRLSGSSVETDGKSIYTFEQILSSPTILSDLVESSPKNPSGANNKRPALFKSLSRKKSSTKKEKSTEKTKEKSHTGREQTGATQATDASNVSGQAEKAVREDAKARRPKKLKKAVPKDVRRAHKELQQRSRSNSAISGTISSPRRRSESLIDKSTDVWVDETPTEVGNGDDKVATTSHDSPIPSTESSSHKSSAKSWRRLSGRQFPAKVTSASDSDDECEQPNSAEDNPGSINAYASYKVDFRSIAQSIGSSPYDISTRQFRGSFDSLASRPNHDRMRSPFEIGNGVAEPRATGMDEKEASELARKRSRDVMEKNLAQRNRLREKHASPRRKLTVEDRFPEWQGKPVSTKDQLPQQPRVIHRRWSSAAESIPPIPELPSDVEVKAKLAHEMMIKRSKNGPVPLPLTKSVSATDNKDEAQELGRQTSDDDLPESKQSVDDHQDKESVPHLEAQRAVTPPSSSENATDSHQQEVQPLSPTQDAQHPGWPGWENQARLWKQRRPKEATVPKPDTSEDSMQTRPVTSPPAIVVTRYVTPSAGSRDVPSRETTSTKPQIVLPIRPKTIQQSKSTTEKCITRTNSASSTRASITLDNGVTRLVRNSRTSIQLNNSTRTYQPSAPASSQPSSPGITANNGSKFIPYDPSYASQVEQSRLESLSRLNGAAECSTESLPSCFDRPNDQLARPNKSCTSLHDHRYSGGLEYEWKRGVGISGSAGTRTSVHTGMERSFQTKVAYGLDLTDIPIFLRRQTSPVPTSGDN